MTSKFKLSGLTCEACEKLSAKRITKINGVTNVVVNKTNGLAEITADREISLAEVQGALQGTEYRAELIN
jgi:copper chaperone CopZ